MREGGAETLSLAAEKLVNRRRSASWTGALLRSVVVVVVIK